MKSQGGWVEALSSKLPEKVKERRKLVRKIRKIRARKPEFVRQESWRYKRVKPAWRRPRGIDSKMRIGKKGWPASPNVGYRSPKAIRGLHPSGLAEVLVYRVEDLKGLNPEIHAVRIAGSVGRKKRLEIFREASQLGLKVLNPPKLKAESVEAEEESSR
ncbi:MAG: 50S ribosomal protein L32e [Candidatus Hecatellaceae archaeon]